uniref:Rho guanine nucleotide exchange factor (GEF) 12b n=1 Tax=Astyanax mexicanus TaxID=7994 RepID=A0A8B9HC95_ASTMX
ISGTVYLSILSRDHPPDKKPKSDKVPTPPSLEFDPTGLVQRCVIIQKDENGFGLTVSGDNPVFVQLVKEDGAAMRAGVQTGDRIIKVRNEFLKISGSYVALTVLGRPPGMPQIPLSEGDGEGDPTSTLSSPHSPGLPTTTERSSSSSNTSPSDRITSPLPLHLLCVSVRNPTPKLLKEIQEAKKHIPLLQDQLNKATGDGSLSPRPGETEVEEGGDVDSPLPWQSDSVTETSWSNNTTPVTLNPVPESPYQRDTPCQSPKTPRDSLTSCPSPDAEDTPDMVSESSAPHGQTPYCSPQIIGAEDDDFDTEQEQMNGQCSCFQTIELLKSRPAHLAAFLHHVVSQFDPAPLLCYLYAELYKQSNSKDTRRLFTEIHTAFMDRTAHLKVPLTDAISADLGKLRYRRKPDLIPEDVQRQYVQQLQDTLLPDIQKHLEDFRQKRSMGLTLAEAELTRLDTERVRDRVAMERERSRAEHIINKIDEIGATVKKIDATVKKIGATVKKLGATVGELRGTLFYTERAHLRMLKVLDNVFYQRMTRETILPPADIKNIFTNLEEIVQMHVSIMEQMTAIRKKNETAVVDIIGDDLLSWFSGAEEEKIKHAVGTFCSNQPFALELIKSRQKKDQRFASFVQDAESNRQCRRLQLKDMIPVEMQRLTKYPLLLESIAKYTDDAEEKSKVKRAGECCRNILNHVNQEVKEAENKQRLEDYQRRLDLSSLKQSEHPMIAEFKNLDLTKRKMVHEGPLSWKVNKDKTIELYTLLLEDILVLMQRQDEKLILKCHSKNLAGTAETKHIFSPIIKLSTVMVRSVATDNKSFFVLSMSDNGAQIYELMAQTVSEQRTWQCLITQRADSMKGKQPNVIPLPQTDGVRDAVEMINSSVPKMNKDQDSLSTGSNQSPEKDTTSCTEIMPGSSAGTNPFETKSEDEGEVESLLPVQDEEEVEAEEVDEEEVEAFLDSDLAYKLPFLKQGSRQAIAIEEKDSEVFDMPPLMADEALRNLAALRQLLINHMASQEEVDKGERGETRAHELRMGSLQGAADTAAPSGSVENGAEKTEMMQARPENAQELPSGDTGFFETSEEYAGSYMVLEGYGGSGESSTDDDVQGSSIEPTAAGDSGIDLKKLLSSSSSQSGGPNLSRQVMTHLRLLQANLQQLKDVESKYNQLCQKHPEEAATDSEENKGNCSRFYFLFIYLFLYTTQMWLHNVGA